jgi:cyclophilin family peptidyl-prolyl cis-trans isomerase
MRLALPLVVVALFSTAALAQDKAGACSAKLKAPAPLMVKLTTSMGPIVLQLDKEKAPVSAQNFASYVDSGHYAAPVFHRVIDGFMIQGGGFSKDMVQKPTQPAIKNEAVQRPQERQLHVAMARTGVRDSATSQFFINVKDNDMLNYRDETQGGWGYAVFGKVASARTPWTRSARWPPATRARTRTCRPRRS